MKVRVLLLWMMMVNQTMAGISLSRKASRLESKKQCDYAHNVFLLTCPDLTNFSTTLVNDQCGLRDLWIYFQRRCVPLTWSETAVLASVGCSMYYMLYSVLKKI